MIAFIILHYKSIKDTLECIDSIEKLKLSNSRIIVVDNGSLDSSTETLRILQDKIDIVFNDRNYGYAKGNNIGIKYAKRKYDPKFYVVINNDIIINQQNMVDEIYRMHELYDFDVLGPKIITRNKINQNPNYLILSKTKDIITHLLKLNIISILIKVNLYDSLKKIKRNCEVKNNINNEDKILIDVPLHGSALIFSDRYVARYDEPFDESTFLYGEEEFLYYRKVRDNLKFVYTPYIKVFHKEDATLNELFKDCDMEKIKFVIRNSKHSLTKLLLKKIKDKLRWD